MATDPYKTLEVSQRASQAEIVAAYRRLARKHHPDLNPKDKTASKRFQEVQAAFDVLSDANSRKLYDRYLNSVESVQQTEPRRPQASATPSPRKPSPAPIPPARGSRVFGIFPVLIFGSLAALWLTAFVARQNSIVLPLPEYESKPEFRNWTDTSAKFNAKAHAVDVKNGQAYLKHADGRIVAVPTERLSSADQEYLAEEVAKGRLKGLTDADMVAISKESKKESKPPQRISQSNQVGASDPQPAPYAQPRPKQFLKQSNDVANTARIKTPIPQELADKEERAKLIELLRFRYGIYDWNGWDLKELRDLAKGIPSVDSAKAAAIKTYTPPQPINFVARANASERLRKLGFNFDWHKYSLETLLDMERVLSRHAKPAPASLDP